MASRKKPTEPPSTAAFGVILEDIHAHNKVFGEALGSFREQVDRRFEQVAQQFEAVRHEMRDGFERVDVRFEQVDQRLGRLETDTRLIDQRLGRLETDTHLIKLAVVDQGAELKKIRARR